MDIPFISADRYYTKTHEWALVENGLIKVGITDYAQRQLHEIVGCELPEEGREIRKGEILGVVSSVKAVADVYSPVSGKIVKVNKALEVKPELLNLDPYGEGWIAIIDPTDMKELETLLKPNEYQAEIIKEKMT
ncbi:MAG: glycine cleavage system protein GcvH [Candidatus Methanomethylicia archaeon]